MSANQRPRHDQIAELTRALDIPLPPVDPEILELILEAITHAWQHVKTSYPTVLKQDKEASISALLETRLNADLSAIPGLELVVSSVDRGRETITFNGEKIEVRPDLSFKLTHLDARFRLIAECKIIDTQNGKTAGLYRDNGISRFVKGDYAWACREALMLGYVRCGSKLQPTMLSSLNKHPEMACTSSELRAPPNTLIASHALGTSKHDRQFAYVHSTDRVPGQIELWHLWLDV